MQLLSYNSTFQFTLFSLLLISVFFSFVSFLFFFYFYFYFSSLLEKQNITFQLIVSIQYLTPGEPN